MKPSYIWISVETKRDICCTCLSGEDFPLFEDEVRTLTPIESSEILKKKFLAHVDAFVSAQDDEAAYTMHERRRLRCVYADCELSLSYGRTFVSTEKISIAIARSVLFPILSDIMFNSDGTSIKDLWQIAKVFEKLVASAIES